MSTLWVTEFAGLGNKSAHGGQSDYPSVPPLGTQTVTYTTSAATANAFSNGASHVAISASAACHIAFGQAPEADTGDMRLEAGVVYMFTLAGPGLKVAAIDAV